jgi:hypothetical protein
VAARGTIVQTPQDAERNIFLIDYPAGRRPESYPGQLDQLAIISLPQLKCRTLIAGLELPEPAGDRLVTGHDRLPVGE